MEQITVESIPIMVGREDDGRWWADIELMPGGDGVRRNSRGGDCRRPNACVARGRRLHRPRRGDSRTVHQGLFGGMSHWRSVKARQLLAALLRIGWHQGHGNHDSEEVGPGLLAQIAKKIGLQPEDLQAASGSHKPVKGPPMRLRCHSLADIGECR